MAIVMMIPYIVIPANSITFFNGSKVRYPSLLQVDRLVEHNQFTYSEGFH